MVASVSARAIRVLGIGVLVAALPLASGCNGSSETNQTTDKVAPAAQVTTADYQIPKADTDAQPKVEHSAPASVTNMDEWLAWAKVQAAIAEKEFDQLSDSEKSSAKMEASDLRTNGDRAHDLMLCKMRPAEVEAARKQTAEIFEKGTKIEDSIKDAGFSNDSDDRQLDKLQLDFNVVEKRLMALDKRLLEIDFKEYRETKAFLDRIVIKN